MSSNKERYFNFPIELLDRFIENKIKVLNDICDYAIYSHSLGLEYGDEFKKFKNASSFYNLSLVNQESSLKNGKRLNKTYSVKSPKVGINLSIWWDFYKNEKTEYEMVCLLGFLAIKSIVQKKAYCKITNKYWLSRMNGQAKTQEFTELSSVLKKYTNEYQTKKIKSDLRDNWGLVTYSRFTRGFYVSFKLTLDQLVYEAEKRRKSVKEKQYKEAEKQAVKKALEKLHETRA